MSNLFYLALSLPMTSKDKSEWSATGSSSYNDDPTIPVAQIIDGDISKSYTSTYSYKPWVQIDLKSSHRIRAVTLWGNSVKIL